ncbi:hypothetical protein [Pannonibacter sp. SL95]|nr:hypothetical protein [Pannonibacter sp. SL95]MCY1704525.1 hypothetical protein [Pannonibacter sp. SL95]
MTRTLERLIAEVGELEPGFASAVSDGRYKKISDASFHVPGLRPTR